MVHGGSVRFFPEVVSGGQGGVGSAGFGQSELDVQGRDLADLLLGGGSPESALTGLLEHWVARGRIRWGGFFLRRQSGWVRLTEFPRRLSRVPGEAAPENEAQIREALGVTLEPTGAGVDVGGLMCFGLGTVDEEIGRLVVRPLDSAVRSLSLSLHTSLTLFARGVRDREAGDTAALRQSFSRRLLAEHDRNEAAVPESSVKFPEIVGRSSRLMKMLTLVQRAAPTDVSILVQGESGTGKELIARAIHGRSKRSSGPFVTENCAAFSPTLLESEIFGCEKGAYTGSDRTRPGLIERAHGGTLFLDEIGEMDLRLQSKLLRVLQEREVRRVGASQTIPVDFRLITATHRDLPAEVQAGRFREDLLFRILVIRIDVPPLRSRRDDVPTLVRHFLRQFAEQHKVPVPTVDREAMRLLCNHSWPGNIRELRNEMERAFTLSPELIRPEVLSEHLREPAVPRQVARKIRSEFGEDIRGLEHAVIGGVIRDVLEEAGGNKARAAKVLGLPKTTLYRRLETYGIVVRDDGTVTQSDQPESA